MLLLAVKLYFIIGEVVMLGVLYVPSVRREIAGEPAPAVLLSILVVGTLWPIPAAIACVAVIEVLIRRE